MLNFIRKINRIRKASRKKKRTILSRKFTINLIKENSVNQNYSFFYNSNNEFSNLCEKYGTDKGYVEFNKKTPYGWRAHTYSVFYHTLFSHCKDNIKLVFECGIGTNNLDIESNMSMRGKPGASLRVWRDYFKNAQIIGADVDKRILFKEERIKTFYVNQLEINSIEIMWSKIQLENFDLIIDDGLHTMQANLTFFKNSYKKLKQGGVYIIEDVDFSYLNEIKNKLIDYDPEVIILNDKYFNQDSINNFNLNDNNLLVIRKKY